VSVSVQRQASGATIVIASDLVMKYGPPGPVADRIDIQYEWLNSYNPLPEFVQVRDAASGVYVMERLDPLPTWADAVNVVDVIWGALSRNVWAMPTDELKWSEHYSYVSRKAKVLDWKTEGEFWALASWVDLEKLPQTDVHGDPTIDNVLLRGRTGQLVLTDPIPPYEPMPGVAAVDVGKIMTSLYGFERIKYGIEYRNADEALTSLLKRLSFDAQTAAYYMCAVHFLRLIPYHLHLKNAYLEVLERVIADGLRLRRGLDRLPASS
jgi:hypothetical protein